MSGLETTPTPAASRPAAPRRHTARRRSANSTTGNGPGRGVGSRSRSGGSSAVARLRTAFLAAWPALALYAFVRFVGTAVVAWRAGGDGPGLGKLLATRFDTVYYVHIAEAGYAAPLAENCTVQGELCKYAFFPVYPGLVRGFSSVTPFSTEIVAWGVSVLSSLVAAWGIFAVAQHLHDRRTALFAVVLWGIVPHAMVQSMAYTEPLFTALAAWALYAVLKQHWITAGLLASLTGLTRPSGSAVVAAVALCAAWALFATFRKRQKEAPPGAGRGRLLAAILIAPVGWFAWFGWVGYRAGRWDGYFQLQERWGSTFDGGSFTMGRIVDTFTKMPTNLNAVVATFTVLGALLLFVICLLERQHAAPLIYAALLLLIAVGGAGYFHSKARFLLPAFPLLFPLAKAFATARPRVAYAVVTAAVLVSSAYGSYLMLVWKYSP
ncbi:glycosyltransferase family 39 protein [Streptomyces sp. NPDC048057]|uniref:glycosyltransferase family 39 protein n=1 Tax=Streptomyces sp. NPDC048057 TaxID=3155628 RepID=UPI0033D2045C